MIAVLDSVKLRRQRSRYSSHLTLVFVTNCHTEGDEEHETSTGEKSPWEALGGCELPTVLPLEDECYLRESWC